MDLENLEELCSIEDNEICPPIVHDPILKNSEEIEQALSRKRKAEVEQALLSYHQLEKRLKSDAFSQDMVLAVGEGQNDLNNMQCNNNNSNNNNNNHSGDGGQQHQMEGLKQEVTRLKCDKLDLLRQNVVCA